MMLKKQLSWRLYTGVWMEEAFPTKWCRKKNTQLSSSRINKAGKIITTSLYKKNFQAVLITILHWTKKRSIIGRVSHSCTTTHRLKTSSFKGNQSLYIMVRRSDRWESSIKVKLKMIHISKEPLLFWMDFKQQSMASILVRLLTLSLPKKRNSSKSRKKIMK